MRKLLLLMVVCAFIASDSSWGEIPHKMNFQGMLTDDVGQPLSGAYDLTFAVYRVSFGGTALWTETLLAVNLENGLFSVVMGETVPIPDSVFNEPERYLGIQVGTDTELTPRILLTSTGFAYRALVADSALVAVSTPAEDGWIDEGTVVRLETATDSVGIGTASPQTKLDVSGDVRASDSLLARQLCLGRPLTSEGILRLYGELSAEPVIEAHESSGGGFLSISGDGSAIFDMSTSGDSSVVLPVSSISNTEIENEAGIGNSQRTAGSVNIEGSVTTILSRKMNFPSEGHVLVIATGNMAVAHKKETEDRVIFGVSNTDVDLPSSQDHLKSISAAWDSADVYDIVTVHGYFTVTAGENWFYFLGKKLSGGNMMMFDAELNVLFVPTSYSSATLISKPEIEELKRKIEALENKE